MTAEELAIARWLVACKGWQWLPGMAYVSTKRDDKMRRGRLALAPSGGTDWHAVEDWYHGDESEYRDPGTFATWGWLPDLADPLTRLGVMQVVRDAHDDQSIGITKAGDEWTVTRAFISIGGRAAMEVMRSAPTGLEALAAALEAAP